MRIMTHIMYDIETVMTGKGNVKEAQTSLAKLGVGEDQARRFWAEITETPGGANDYNGALVPNLESWKNADASIEFKAAMIRGIDDTIVTPGLERPLLADQNIGWRLLYQFKSFVFGSTTRSLVRAGQDVKEGRVVDVALWISGSVALGMASYYIRSVLAGEEQYERMQEAGLDKWLDEGIARSGVLGPIQLFLDTAQRIPGLLPYTSFSGQRSDRANRFSPYQQAPLQPTRTHLRNGRGLTNSNNNRQ